MGLNSLPLHSTTRCRHAVFDRPPVAVMDPTGVKILPLHKTGVPSSGTIIFQWVSLIVEQVSAIRIAPDGGTSANQRGFQMADKKKHGAARANVPFNYPTENDVRGGMTAREVYERAVDAHVIGKVSGLARYTPLNESPHDTQVRRLMLEGQRADINERLSRILPEDVGDAAASPVVPRRGKARRALRRIDALIR